MGIIKYIIIIEMVVGTLFLWRRLWDVSGATKEEILQLQRTYEEIQGFTRKPLIVADTSIRGRCNRLFGIAAINGLATAALLWVHIPEWWQGWELIAVTCLFVVEVFYSDAHFEHKRGLYGTDLGHSKKMLE